MAKQQSSPWFSPKPATLHYQFDPAKVQEFHSSLPGYQPTRLISLPSLAQECGVKHVFLKDESQRLGLPAFKILGASWGVFKAVTAHIGLPDKVSLAAVREAIQKNPLTVYTATDGNHGRAVAFMAKLLGLSAVTYIPYDMDFHTKEALTNTGAKIIVSGDYDNSVIEAAKAATQSDGGILVQDTGFAGYEEIPMWIIEGYSTIFHETDRELARLRLSPDLIITPVGVGSLAHSMVRHYKKPNSKTKVIAVEPTSAACLNISLRAGHSTTIQTSPTIMAGMNCGTVSSTAWDDLQASIDASITISDMDSHNAVLYLETQGISSGPCGAAGVAALKQLTNLHEVATGLHKESVVLLINTEGKRPYVVPGASTT